MPISFDFRQELYGDWATARAFLVEQFDRLFAGLGLLQPLGAAVTAATPVPSILTVTAAGTPLLATALPVPLSYASANVFTPTALAANTNNYGPNGIATAGILRLSATGAVDLTGIVAPSSYLFRIVVNVGASTITLKHASASSAAANRFRCPGAVDKALTTGLAVWTWYDATSAVWQVL